MQTHCHFIYALNIYWSGYPWELPEPIPHGYLATTAHEKHRWSLQTRHRLKTANCKKKKKMRTIDKKIYEMEKPNHIVNIQKRGQSCWQNNWEVLYRGVLESMAKFYVWNWLLDSCSWTLWLVKTVNIKQKLKNSIMGEMGLESSRIWHYLEATSLSSSYSNPFWPWISVTDSFSPFPWEIPMKK